jgi:hypothetical protein
MLGLGCSGRVRQWRSFGSRLLWMERWGGGGEAFSSGEVSLEAMR